MLGIILAIISSSFKGFEKIIHRKILVKEDSLAYAFLWHLISSIFLLPIAIYELYKSSFILPTSLNVWGLVLASSTLWALAAYLGFRAYNSLDVGLKEIFGKSKIIFVFLLSIFLLKESITWQKIASVAIIFSVLIIMSYKKGKRFGSLRDKAVQYTLLSALVMSCAIIIDKYSQNYFTSGFYSFLVYFIPALILLPFIFIAKKTKELKQIYGTQLKWVTLSVILGVSYYYLMLRAFKLADTTIVYPIIESSILITIIGGFFYLKEKTDILKRIVCALMIIIALIILVIN